MSAPQVVIDGTWLSAVMPWGDLEWSTVWPGGSDALQFGAARSHRLFRPDAIVELYWGGECLWGGTMLDPTRGAPIVAEGLYRRGEDEPALNAGFDVASNINDAIALAVGRGLPWSFPTPTVGSPTDMAPQPGVLGMPALDPNQVHSISQYLDASAQERGQEWGIDPATREPRMTTWPAATLHMLPGVDGLAISRDGYASTLHARYLDSATSTYKTVSRTDAAAQARWGRVPHTITEPIGEGVAMTTARAEALVDGLLAQGRSQIGWTTPLEVQYGDVVTEYGQPVALEKITAGQTIRLHGLVEDVADLAGRTWTDVPIARVSHKGAVATIEPRRLVSPMNDVLAGVS